LKKFVVTADIHLQVKKNIPLQWQQNRYKLLAEVLIDKCKQQLAPLLILGDLLEKAEPSLLEQEILWDFITTIDDAGIQIYLIGGNHETTEKGKCTFDYLKPALLSKIIYSNRLSFSLQGEATNLHMLSHCCLHEADQLPVQDGHTNILLSHFRPTVSKFIKEEIDVASLLKPFDLCLAGDIHSDFSTGKLVYTNSPLNHSFEAAPDCGYLLLTVNKGKTQVLRIPTDLPNLVQLTIKASDWPVECDTKHFYRVSVEGTPEELRSITSTAPNVNVERIPLIEDSYADMEEEAPTEDFTIESDLIAYMIEMGITEEKIAKMIDVFKESE
jgi:DNA repair exonuclease SbcCD nuclease subunit